MRQRRWDLDLRQDRVEQLPSRYAGLFPYLSAFAQLDLAEADFLFSLDGTRIAVSLARRGTESAKADACRIAVSVSPAEGIAKLLSTRELEIVTLIAAGLPDKTIAHRSGTSARTVSTQVARMLAKTGLPGRAALAASCAAEQAWLLPVAGAATVESQLKIFQLDRAVKQGQAVKQDRAVKQGPHETSTVPARTYGSQTPIRIGILVSGGDFADDGTEALRGAQLALGEVMQEYRGLNAPLLEATPISVDPLSADSVEHALHVLAALDPDAVLSTFVSALAPPILEFAAELERPFLHTNSWSASELLVKEDSQRYTHLFQTSPTEGSYAAGLYNFIAHARHSATLAPPRIAVIELDGFGCQVTTGDLEYRLRAIGVSIASVSRVGFEVSGVEDIVRGALASDPGLVVVSHLSIDAATQIQRAIRTISATIPVYHLYTPSLPRFFEQVAVAQTPAALLWSTVTGRNTDMLGSRFSTAFQARYGVEPGWSQASAAYDQARILGQAFVFTGSRRPADISAHVRQTVYRGVNGTYFLGNPGQTVAGYPYDSTNLALSTPLMTYAYEGGRMRVIQQG